MGGLIGRNMALAGGGSSGGGSSGDANTLLLIQSDATDGSTMFYDSSAHARTVTASNVTHQDTESKFGATSMYFNGSSGYLSVPDHADWDFAASDPWTFDMWVKINTEKVGVIFNWGTGASGFQINTTEAGKIDIYQGFGSRELITVTVLGTTSWHHVALVNDGTNCKLYLDGVEEDTQTSFALVASNTDIHIGKYVGSSASYFSGYLEELQFSDVARWVTDFTPPLTPYS